MNILKGIVTELRERRLWPVAVALLVGLVAVPIVLSKSPSPSAPTQGPSAGGSGSTGHTVSVKLANAAQGGLHGKTHDPFAQQSGSTTTPAGSTPVVSAPVTGGGASGSAGASVAHASGASGASGSGAAATASFGGGGSSVTSVSSFGGGGSSSSPAPSPSVSAPAPSVSKKPAPTGLSATQTYQVALQISNPSGGLNLIDPLKRLSPVPSASEPLLVELGVEQGGHHVLFAVQPGTVVSGRGTCTPGPIDCEILSLSPEQAENVSTQSAGGATIAQFAITGITAQDYSSVAAANKARNAVSSVGADLLTDSPLSALSLFQYEPSVGAVVDLRNLTVGGN